MSVNSDLKFAVKPIGKVHSDKGEFWLEVDEPFKKGLKDLDKFSHLIAFWWIDQNDTKEDRSTIVTKIPYADGRPSGVFACRSEFRPNPIAITTCAILSCDVEKGSIVIPYIDAFNGTPLIDIKPYFPVSDRVRDVSVPSWVSHWPEWYEDSYKMEKIFSDLGL